MYDPDRKPHLDDCGRFCPRCHRDLLLSQFDPVPHPSGDGRSYNCPWCGETLHENAHFYVFAEDQSLPPKVVSLAGLGQCLYGHDGPFSWRPQV